MNPVSRTSYDTALKHLVRHDALANILTSEQIASIPRSNISRWKNEADDKYSFCELNQLVKEELEFIKRCFVIPFRRLSLKLKELRLW